MFQEKSTFVCQLMFCWLTCRIVEFSCTVSNFFPLNSFIRPYYFRISYFDLCRCDFSFFKICVAKVVLPNLIAQVF